jgi:hypothetical protein
MDKVSEFNLVHALSKQIVREHQTVKVLSASNWDGEINQYEKQAAEEVLQTETIYDSNRDNTKHEQTTESPVLLQKAFKPPTIQDVGLKTRKLVSKPRSKPLKTEASRRTADLQPSQEYSLPKDTNSRNGPIESMVSL